MSSESDLASDLTQWLDDHPVIQLGMLFGSAGEGRAGFASDLDLAVMARRSLSAMEKKDAIEALAQISGRPVDLVDLQETGGPLLRRILHTGTRLYCADEALYAELLKRHVFAQADFAPYRRRLLKERRQRWIGPS
jgi:predicted nucleotidyltransferase